MIEEANQSTVWQWYALSLSHTFHIFGGFHTILASSPFAKVFITFCPGIASMQPGALCQGFWPAHSCLQIHEDSVKESHMTSKAYSVHKCDSNRIRWVSMYEEESGNDCRQPQIIMQKLRQGAEVQLIAVCIADARDHKRNHTGGFSQRPWVRPPEAPPFFRALCCSQRSTDSDGPDCVFH